MSLRSFLQWEEAYPRRFEFVDGRPVHRSEVGSRGETMEVRSCMLAALHDRARATGLKTTVDERVVCGTGNIRYVDAQVTPVAAVKFPDAARAVIDVLPSDFATVDFVDRLKDFDSVSGITAYLAVMDDRIRCMLFVREGAHLILSHVSEDKAAAVSFPPFGFHMTVGDFYSSFAGLGRVRPA